MIELKLGHSIYQPLYHIPYAVVDDAFTVWPMMILTNMTMIIQKSSNND